MKKIIFAILLVLAFFQIITGQKKKEKSSAQIIQEGWQDMRNTRDSMKILITKIKNLSDQKIIYRTKLIEHTDTVWRIDTCISIITRLDSERIAVMFQNRDIQKETKRGKRVFFFFRKKYKSK